MALKTIREGGVTLRPVARPIVEGPSHCPQLCSLCGRLTDSLFTLEGSFFPICRPCESDAGGWITVLQPKR